MSLINSQDRAIQSLHLITSAILPELRGVKPGRDGSQWHFYCPLEHRKPNPSAVIWIDDDGWISVHCYDCQRHAELRDAVVTPAVGRGRREASPGQIGPGAMGARTPNVHGVPARARDRSIPIPIGNHPARRWMEERFLWRPDVPVPPSLRWLPAASTIPGPHTGAGSILAILAGPSEWQKEWPAIPHPTAIETIAIGVDGKPALDRPEDAGGLSKRTLGRKQHCFLVIGCPTTSTYLHPVRVAEGVADALALASRFPGPAVATMGDAGMRSSELAAWLSRCPAGVVIHADNDEAGRESAGWLRTAINAGGGRAKAVLPSHGKDAADTAAAMSFEAITHPWEDIAASLRKKHDWPEWEIQRQASTLPDGGVEI